MGAFDRPRHQGRGEPAIPFRSRVAWPGVVLGAAPALVAVAAVLRDEDTVVTREALDAVREFMTDGIDSPLYGSDPLAARRGADELRRGARRNGACAARERRCHSLRLLNLLSPSP